MQCLAGRLAQAPHACTCNHVRTERTPARLRHPTTPGAAAKPCSSTRRQWRHQAVLRQTACAAATAAAEPAQAADVAAAELQRWLQQKGAALQASQLQTQGSLAQIRTGLATNRSLRSGEVFVLHARRCRSCHEELRTARRTCIKSHVHLRAENPRSTW